MIIKSFREMFTNRMPQAFETTPTVQTTWTPQDESDIPDNLRITPIYVDPWANDPDRTTRRESGI